MNRHKQNPDAKTLNYFPNSESISYFAFPNADIQGNVY